jgi:hypothetical protein
VSIASDPAGEIYRAGLLAALAVDYTAIPRPGEGLNLVGVTNSCILWVFCSFCCAEIWNFCSLSIPAFHSLLLPLRAFVTGRTAVKLHGELELRAVQHLSDASSDAVVIGNLPLNGLPNMPLAKVGKDETLA